MRAVAAADAGSAGTRSSRYCGNASISLAWMGRWRMVRIIVRDRGIRHAISDTNSNVRINTNHQDPKTSKNPARRNSEPKNGCAS